MRVLCLVAVLGVVAACSPPVPDNRAGVGFDRRYDEGSLRAQRDRRLEGATPVTTTPLDDQAAAQSRSANSGVAPLQASPDNPPPPAVTDSAGLSREQDFQAVSGERGINDDAERLRQAQSQYQIVAPTNLPTRGASNRPNVVAYALQNTHPVGTPVYRRTRLNSYAKHQRNCAGYASPDLAQEDFLTRGGPENDRSALDPDGDGFACSWNPDPFRRAVGR